MGASVTNTTAGGSTGAVAQDVNRNASRRIDLRVNDDFMFVSGRVDYCVGVGVGNAVTVSVGGTEFSVGVNVAVGRMVGVNDGVKVSGSVGTSVGVPNSGMIVTPGVMVAHGVTVGTFGTQSC